MQDDRQGDQQEGVMPANRLERKMVAELPYAAVTAPGAPGSSTELCATCISTSTENQPFQPLSPEQAPKSYHPNLLLPMSSQLSEHHHQLPSAASERPSS